jgi:3-oxoacyl-[acyl-carrier-protein] synthase II
MTADPRSRLVVTGLGIVSPLGRGVEAVWQRLGAGRSGVRRLPDALVPDVPAKIGGLVPDTQEDAEAGFDLDAIVPVKDQKKMDRFIPFALDAAGQAIAQAAWTPQDDAARERTATIIASGIGGFPALVFAAHTVETKGARRLSPFTIPSFLVNLAAGHVTIRYGFRGPVGAPVTACAASLQAIGDAMRLIRGGEADVAICGGSEACFDRVSLGAFSASRALSTRFNDTPEQASRPFDAARDGFVMGEGSAALVIETLDHARRRGATPLAEIVGYGTTADAFHMTGVPEDGEGAQRAMRLALSMADVSPSVVGYINAHATSTPIGDAAELTAIRAVFGTGGEASISSTKSATGHLLGAAGGVAAVFTILALRDGLLPPTLNLETADPAADGLDVIGPSARRKSIDYALANGFGFGGVNASVLFRRWDGE